MVKKKENTKQEESRLSQTLAKKPRTAFWVYCSDLKSWRGTCYIERIGEELISTRLFSLFVEVTLNNLKSASITGDHS